MTLTKPPRDPRPVQDNAMAPPASPAPIAYRRDYSTAQPARRPVAAKVPAPVCQPPVPAALRPNTRTPVEKISIALFHELNAFFTTLAETDLSQENSAAVLDLRLRARDLQGLVDDAIFFYGDPTK